MYRKQYLVMFGLVGVVVASVGFTSYWGEKTNLPVPIPKSEQRKGDAEKGFQYLITGDFLKSGMPYSYYRVFTPVDTNNYLHRSGKAAGISYDFNLVKAPNGIEVVVPTCLQCHAQVFDGQLYVGLGNTFVDFSQIGKANNPFTTLGVSVMQTFSPKGYEAASAIFNSFDAVLPKMNTAVRGVNAADRLATVLVAHRDPQTLVWQNKPVLDIPKEVVPTDVPAWWLLKKKNAMFYNGFGRGDFAKFLMLSNLLTVKDSAEAREVNSHFGDVLAYLYSIEPPKYPKTIDQSLAAKGQQVFTTNCSGCHGTYGKEGRYPNLLIPAAVIKTDSMLYGSNQQNPQFIDWFNKSWFAQAPNPAQLVPFAGYIAPPLDGVWITAPYLHNGSVPTLRALLNSKERPTYWKRNFKHPQYNYNAIGCDYTVEKPTKSKRVYNTTLPGYGNMGHYFGDKLTEAERDAVIEYLKTL